MLLSFFTFAFLVLSPVEPLDDPPPAATATVATTGTKTNVAQVWAANQVDADSTPGNNTDTGTRTPFEDDADSGHDRLLFRLWLSMPNNRALPEGHEVLWRSIEANKVRGGIAQVAI